MPGRTPPKCRLPANDPSRQPFLGDLGEGSMERCHGAVGLVAGALLFLACGDGQSPVQPTPPTAGPIQAFADREREFGSAIAALGTATVIDFDDVDATPVTDTIQGPQ